MRKGIDRLARLCDAYICEDSDATGQKRQHFSSRNLCLVDMLDPVTKSVIWNKFLSISREMSTIIERSSQNVRSSAQRRAT